MKINIEKSVKIENLVQWFEVAQPKGGNVHWKPGRSAMEMARFALSNEFAKVISKVLKECGLKDCNFKCEPEKQTTFEKGMGTGGPRNHDLLMLGDDILIGIEAKVSESFDEKIKDKRKNATENMHLRLNSCLDYLYETRPQNAEDLYYQLFSSTVGSIIEAKRQKKNNVISLFVVFVGDVDKEDKYETNVNNNDIAFNEFCQTFGLGENGGKLPKIPGAPDVNCWIKKIKINIGGCDIK